MSGFWSPWCGAFDHPSPIEGPVTVMFRSGLVRASKDAAALRWGWSDTSELAQIVAYRPHVSAGDNEASGAGPAVTEQLRDPWAAISEIGERLARLDRERLEELKHLRQDMDGHTAIAGAQRVVNEDLNRRLGELEKALGTLLATKEPAAAPEPPPNTLTRAYAAVVLLQRLGYSWDGRSWEPTNSGPGYVSGAA